MSSPTKRTRLVVVGGCLLCALTILVSGLVARWQGAREASRRGICYGQLKRLGVALRSYHATYGSLPPAATHDRDGRPLLSWRVLLLPFLGEAELYRQFRPDEPWDSPHNARLLENMPQVFRCPAETLAVQTTTNYVAVVGNDTAFPPNRALSLPEITDDIRSTVLLIEIGSSTIPWTQPSDLLDSEFHSADEIGSPHQDVRNVLFANGTTRWISQYLSPSVSAAIITTHGGESIDPGDY